MRRRFFLASSMILPLAACQTREDSGNSPRWNQNGTHAVSAGEYGIMLSNYGAGDDPQARVGLLAVVSPDGRIAATDSFLPAADAGIFAHDGALSWGSRDAVHHWGGEHKVWGGLPVEQPMIQGLLAADRRILAVLNGSASDMGSDYQSGLVLLDDTGMKGWEHIGTLTDGVAWLKGVGYGYTARTLSDRGLRLASLEPDADSRFFGAEIEPSTLWGTVSDGNHILTLHSTSTTGRESEILFCDPGSDRWRSVTLSGEGADAQYWYTQSVPSHLRLIGKKLYWLTGRTLWAADPHTGETSLVAELPPEFRWDLHANALIGLQLTEVGDGATTWALSDRDPTTGRERHLLADLRVGGPEDLLPSGAVLISRRS